MSQRLPNLIPTLHSETVRAFLELEGFQRLKTAHQHPSTPLTMIIKDRVGSFCPKANFITLPSVAVMEKPQIIGTRGEDYILESKSGISYFAITSSFEVLFLRHVNGSNRDLRIKLHNCYSNPRDVDLCGEIFNPGVLVKGLVPYSPILSE